jgi:uncharacterized protein with ACT and thioredoxin-like domain
MKKIFQLSIKIGSKNSDLYFEDQETAEYTFDLLMKMLSDKAKKEIKIEANFHEIYTKEIITEQLLGILGLTVGEYKC